MNTDEINRDKEDEGDERKNIKCFFIPVYPLYPC